jgi:hypothetical protein
VEAHREATMADGVAKGGGVGEGEGGVVEEEEGHEDRIEIWSKMARLALLLRA